MKSAVESLNPTRVKLSVEVPFDELKPSLDAAYKKIGQQINVPGFRRGKVPAMVIDQRVGRETVLVEAVNDALPNLYTQALRENDLTPLSQPELDLEEIKYGDDLAFTAEVDVKPKIELPEFHGIEAQVDDAAVSDEDVDAELDRLRERFATLTVVERPAESGDYVTIDLSAAKDGEPIEEAQASGMSYRIGDGTMIDGLDDAIVGLSAGEEATFTTKLVAGEHRNDPVEVTVKVSAVKLQELPELDDEFAQGASEFDTVEELRADVRERLVRAARLEQAAAARDAVLEKLLSMVDVPLPEAAVETEKASRRESIDEQLSYIGMGREEYLTSQNQTEEQFGEELDSQVRRAMTTQFVLDEISRIEEVGVEESEMAQIIVQRAQQVGVTPEQYMQHAVEHDHIPELVGEIQRAKSLGHLVESANVTDTSGRHVELALLLPDGTYAEPEPETDGQEEGQVAQAPVAPTTDAAAGLVVAGDYLVVEDDSEQSGP